MSLDMQADAHRPLTDLFRNACCLSDEREQAGNVVRDDTRPLYDSRLYSIDYWNEASPSRITFDSCFGRVKGYSVASTRRASP